MQFPKTMQFPEEECQSLETPKSRQNEILEMTKALLGGQNDLVRLSNELSSFSL